MGRIEDLQPGALVAKRYQVLEKIAEGSSSVVLRVLDLKAGRECALKLLQGWEKLGGQLLERLRRELVLGQRVDHPGCCRLFELAEADGVAFLTLELVRGLRLDTLLERAGPLPLPAALSMAAQAAAAVAALHEQGIVHRDIKAQNLIVGDSGRLKLLDLGFSWSAEVASLTASGAILGTPTHLAPEYLLSGQFSARTDVYASRGPVLSTADRAPAACRAKPARSGCDGARGDSRAFAEASPRGLARSRDAGVELPGQGSRRQAARRHRPSRPLARGAWRPAGKASGRPAERRPRA